jgi:hypothetical protein
MASRTDELKNSARCFRINVKSPADAIGSFIKKHNCQPKAFVRNASVGKITARLEKAKEYIPNQETLHQLKEARLRLHPGKKTSNNNETRSSLP